VGVRETEGRDGVGCCARRSAAATAPHRLVRSQEYFGKFLAKNVRPDGRSVTKVRKTKITVGKPHSSVPPPMPPPMHPSLSD
jgi:hypothetical protein